ncbi:MAG TPA: cytochrome c nitrite reductase small subunit [Thermoanaerobaculia bacterium]
MRGRWMVGSAVLGLVLGLAGGIGGYTFIYAKGASYLSNDAATCANCHVMKDHYDGWIHGSHRAVAVCNDCHTPPGLIPKYATKASNGFWHSFAFTTGRFPDPLRIKPSNYEVTQRACRKCHQEIVDAIDRVAGEHGGEDALDCIRCHRTVGHDV